MEAENPHFIKADNADIGDIVIYKVDKVLATTLYN